MTTKITDNHFGWPPHGYSDVRAFHQKFGLLMAGVPRQLTQRKLIERIQFLQEELNEFIEAAGLIKNLEGNYEESPFMGQNLAGQADALVDLVYVALGTAAMLGLPWDELWADVQRANMAKVRGVTHRGHKVDVKKPEGWRGPLTNVILNEAGYDASAPEVDDAE